MVKRLFADESIAITGIDVIAMAKKSIPDRLERVELTVSALETLPSQVADLAARTTAVESQIVRLRTEMRGEFSAVRAEMRQEFDDIRSEMATKREMQEGFVATTTELGQRILDAESRSRAMFEELLSRIATISEGRKRRR